MVDVVQGKVQVLDVDDIEGKGKGKPYLDSKPFIKK